MTTPNDPVPPKPGQLPARDWGVVIGAVLAAISMLLLVWRHAQLQTSAMVVLAVALALGLATVLLGWGPYYRRRNAPTTSHPDAEAKRPTGALVAILGLTCAMVFTVGVLISHIKGHETTCKALKHAVVAGQNDTDYPPTSREEKVCRINEYITAFNNGQVHTKKK